MKKVIVVVGPTGVGKTKMGIALSKYYNGEVISGDSMQIYRTMDIGTAKVTKEERDNIVHHLIDIKEPDESYSVKDFQDCVRELIADIQKRGKTAIIVGGTGLYVKAALYDYDFNETASNYMEYKEKYKNHTNEKLYAHLQTIDAVTATTLHPNNRQRILRAIEIFETTGVKKSEVIATQKHTCIYDAIFIGLTMERTLLYERIDERVDRMDALGLENEVSLLYQQGYTKELQSMKAIGYKEWFLYFEGKQSREEVVALIKKNSRNYAKRQYTWFKNQLPIVWFDVDIGCFSNTIHAVMDTIEG